MLKLAWHVLAENEPVEIPVYKACFLHGVSWNKSLNSRRQWVSLLGLCAGPLGKSVCPTTLSGHAILKNRVEERQRELARGRRVP